MSSSTEGGRHPRRTLRNTTVVIVSHQPQVLEKFARKAAVLMDGKLHVFDTLEEAKQLYDYETQG
jgi:capsular polysaccharide transport system ATP-binding protein